MRADGRSDLSVNTLRHRVAAAHRRLLDAGIGDHEAALDARLLAEHVLGWTTAQYFADGGSAPPPDFDRRYDALIDRRIAREPFAYIVGRQEFWGLELAVTPAVLIPRPESELIVEIALEILHDASAPAEIADVGTGSGSLAIALAKERPRARVVATDASAAALAVARQNAKDLGVADRIEFRETNLLDGIPESFDLIVSNPPYVRSIDQRGLQPEVQAEPALALFAGPDGLDLIRSLLLAAPPRLRPGGRLAFEFGYGQDDAVGELISTAAGLRMVGVRADLQGIPRVAIAAREP